VLTTAFALAALLLPAALLGPSAGLELLHPVAVTALGGLVTSSVVLLFLLPPLLLATHGHRRAPLAAEPAEGASVAERREGVSAPPDGVRPAPRRVPVAPRPPADDVITSATPHLPGDEGNDR
jgi:hypothetical protein